MKYSRAANASLDAGMVLMILGLFAGALFVLGIRDDAMYWAIGAIGAGLMCFAASKYLARIKLAQSEEKTSAGAVHLKRVK